MGVIVWETAAEKIKVLQKYILVILQQLENVVTGPRQPGALFGVNIPAYSAGSPIV